MNFYYANESVFYLYYPIKEVCLAEMKDDMRITYIISPLRIDSEKKEMYSMRLVLAR